MSQSSCERDTLSKSYPGVKLASVPVRPVVHAATGFLDIYIHKQFLYQNLVSVLKCEVTLLVVLMSCKPNARTICIVVSILRFTYLGGAIGNLNKMIIKQISCS